MLLQKEVSAEKVEDKQLPKSDCAGVNILQIYVPNGPDQQIAKQESFVPHARSIAA